MDWFDSHECLPEIPGSKHSRNFETDFVLYRITNRRHALCPCLPKSRLRTFTALIFRLMQTWASTRDTTSKRLGKFCPDPSTWTLLALEINALIDHWSSLLFFKIIQSDPEPGCKTSKTVSNNSWIRSIGFLVLCHSRLYIFFKLGKRPYWEG